MTTNSIPTRSIVISRPLSGYVLRDLMMEALAYDQTDLPVGDELFCNYNYAGSQGNLFTITEFLALKKGYIISLPEVQVRQTGWGIEGRVLYSGGNTNFMPREVQALSEAFWILLKQGIIAPGGYAESVSLPYFHVTPHGWQCIQAKEILPYDPTGYLGKVYAIPKLDQWVKSYITEATQCFNSGCHHAATIMVGLAAEKLTLDLIDAFKVYLGNHSLSFALKANVNIAGQLDQAFDTELDSNWTISHKYNTFKKYYDAIKNHKQDVVDIMEKGSMTTYREFIRLTRNEVSHPGELHREETDTLLLLTSFAKFIALVTELTQTLKTV